MGDSGPPPYPGNRDNRPPRNQHRNDPRNGRSDKRSEDEDSRYSSDWTESSHKYHRERDRDRDRHREERRHREEPSRNQHYEERGPSREHRDRGRDGYREREHRHEDRGPRNQTERNRDRYQDRDHPRSERSYNQYQGREEDQRPRSNYDERERREYSKHGSDRQSYPPSSKPYYPSERYTPDESQMYDMEYSEEPEGGILDCNKCRYLCSARGILQMLEVTLNALVLICLISSYFVLSGFSAGMASGGFGGGYYPFEGQELQEVRQLDQEFTLLRAPLLYGGLTVSLLMGTLTLAILAAGAKHLLRLTARWLVIEAAFALVACLGYTAAVGVFLHFVLQINATDVCKRRERLYARNGLTWMNCHLAGTDGGAAAFAIILIILYGVSVVLTVRAYRERRAMQE